MSGGVEGFHHRSVLLDEVVTLLRPGEGRVFVDGTLGAGGHAEALLQRGARVLGIDRDPRALEAARARLGGFGDRFIGQEGSFEELAGFAVAQDVAPLDGVLLDLGVSSPQLDEPSRGFSFRVEGPLDMRMSGAGETAAELISRVDEAELERLLRVLGEERFARRIAAELKRTLPKTTLEAAECVRRAVPRRAWPDRIDVSTRTFQALRMAVNDELGALSRALTSLPSVLKVGGVAAIISFHSLEDRAVKSWSREVEGRCRCPPGLPVCGCGAAGTFRVLTRRAVAASESEVAENPRARSARLRAVERVR